MQNQTIQDNYSKELDKGLLKRVPMKFAKSNLILPLRIREGKLRCLYSDENGLFAIKELAESIGVGAEPILLDRDRLLKEINEAYSTLGSVEEVMDTITEEDLSSVATEFELPRDILELTTDAPIIRLLNALLQQAVKDRASDIHIEPYERELDIRMRIDGELRKVLTPPKAVQEALITRVKIMAGLDIAEKRLPQDGRIRLLIGGRDIDVRVSIVPTIHGERAVLRLLDRQQGLKRLEELGFDPSQRETFEKALNSKNGIILVTGPTGSGKTTTLYAALHRIQKEERNIITVEDPVEYQLKGIGQIQVNPRIGLTFARGLRSILRQDPDVIMVGEIRDLETAEIAVHASLTGHLVLSTLHTNDSASAITRLIDMGVEPFLLSSSLVCILAQRLLRLVCPSCKAPYRVSEQEKAYLLEAGVPAAELYRGRGCSLCNGTGYYGRTAVFEVLPVLDPIRRLISRDTSSHEIMDRAKSHGMVSLKESAIRKAVQGQTTLEEALRVVESL